MKKKVLLSSILTIALCLSLIAGSTFALFTSTSSFGIAVNAAKVKMIAGVDALETYSVKAALNGSIKDELGGTYEYAVPITNDVFTNGGSAKFENGELTISKMTPGDKVTFNITGANESNITVRYRYIIEFKPSADNTLLKGLKFTINNEAIDSYMKSYTSAWMELSAGVAMPSVPVVIELPVNMGNAFQEKEAKINVTVQAIQGNADVDITTTEPTIEYYNDATTAADVKELLADPLIDSVKLTQNIAEPVELNNVYNKTIYAQGNDASFVVGNVSNVVIDGLKESTSGNTINAKNANGSLTIQNSEMKSDAGTSAVAILAGPNATLTINKCTISSIDGKTYGIYNSGASGALTIKDSTFDNFGSWAIQINNAIKVDLIIDGCNFTTPDGVLKVLSGVNGNATFTNNTMIGCKGHDGAGADALVVSTSAKWNPLSCTGIKTVTGNTLDGAAWTQN